MLKGLNARKHCETVSKLLALFVVEAILMREGVLWIGGFRTRCEAKNRAPTWDPLRILTLSTSRLLTPLSYKTPFRVLGWNSALNFCLTPLISLPINDNSLINDISRCSLTLSVQPRFISFSLLFFISIFHSLPWRNFGYKKIFPRPIGFKP